MNRDEEEELSKSDTDPERIMARKQILLMVSIGIGCLALWVMFFGLPSVYPTQNNKADRSLHHEYRTYPVMGTQAEVSFYGSKEDAAKAADTVYDIFKDVETTANIFNPQSELSRLNRTAANTPVVCSPLLWDLLTHSRRAWKLSHGAFDITAKPLMDLWGFYRKRGSTLPGKDEIAVAMREVGLNKVKFDDQRKSVFFTVPGMSFDLGGIAKGYAVDRAAQAVKELGIKRGIINLGGNMYCFPLPPPGKDNYAIGIRNPTDRENVCGMIPCLNLSLATSGNYERYVVIGGKRYTHIMNIKTARPVDSMLAVTVTTPKAVDADLLSTSVFINGPEFAREIVQKVPGTSVLLVREKTPGQPPEVMRFGPLDWGKIEF